MTRYLISFEDDSMTFPAEDLPDVARASRGVVREARDAGVWIHGGGVLYDDVQVVGTDGTVTQDASWAGKERIGGFSIIDVPTREDALSWAARIAVACRCAQDVRELMPDDDA